MKSAIAKRSIVLSGHKTSVSLEDAFWRGLKDIAKTTRRTTLSGLIGSIDAHREQANLSCRLCGCTCSITTDGGLRDHAMRHSVEYPPQAADRGERSTYRGMSQRVITRSASWAAKA